MYKMEYSNKPSYIPSIPIWNFELAKSVYNIILPSPNNIPYIAVYLRYDNIQELDVCIDLGGKIQLNDREWCELMTSYREDILDFLKGTTTTSSIDINCCHTLTLYSNITIHFMVSNEDGKRDVIIKTRNGIINLNETFHWEYLLNISDCINAHVTDLKKKQATYVNRINFIKKHLKIRRPTNIEEALQTVEYVYDKKSIVDCEIKAFMLEYLFYYTILLIK